MPTETSREFFHYLSEADWERISDSAYNPSSSTKEEFASEYWGIHDRLRKIVESFAEKRLGSAFVDAFTMNDDYGESRWIAVEAHRSELLGKDFIRTLQRELKEIPDAYLIALESSLVDAPYDGIWDIFITSDSVRVFTRTEAARKYLDNAEQDVDPNA